jgi:anti-sigma regulatory factor (Ser/Thr protein kinase)
VRAEDEQMTLRVPFAAPSVALVRSTLRRWMGERGLGGDRVDDARIVVSELVANSVRHARPLPDGALIVNWCLDGDELLISVTDGGATTTPHTVDAPASALSGRGMTIVDTLVDNWWIEDRRADSTVHTRLAI